MEKLKMESVNTTQKNIDKIEALFPNVITEMRDDNGDLKKGINFELLKQELSGDVADGEECYDFTWVGKKAAIVEGNTSIRKTLRPCIEESKDWEETGNLYIEGDNLDVLKLLQESYLNTVKVIYIDPPYNTGNDFIYKDNFRINKDDYDEQIGLLDEDENRLFKNTETNGRFHSDWCSMLYPRLKLAHNLLDEDGVIFISIDDNEVENIKRMCDEIFGGNNFVERVIWKNKYGSGALTKGFANVHEYILCYSKNPLINIEAPLDDESIKIYEKNKDSKYQIRGGYITQPLATNSKDERPNLVYPIIHEGVEIWPEKQWIWSKERFLKAYENDEIVINKTNGKYSVRSKQYLRDELGNIRKGKPISLMNGPFNQEGTKEIKDLFDGRDPFGFPKPSNLIKYLFSFTINNKNNKEGVFLDFFSGSASSAQALIQLNSEDGGNRKFIMVQLPEPCSEDSEAFKAGYKNICEIGKERIRRAGDKINEEITRNNKQLKIGEEAKPLVDIGFRVLKVDSTNMKDVYYAANEYSQSMLAALESNIKEDRTDLDLLYGVVLDWGLPLSLSHKIEEIEGVSVHTVDEGSLVACFAEKVSERIVREIAMRQPLRVVFRDSSFTNSPDKINVEEIFKLLAPNTTVKVI